MLLLTCNECVTGRNKLKKMSQRMFCLHNCLFFKIHRYLTIYSENKNDILELNSPVFQVRK